MNSARYDLFVDSILFEYLQSDSNGTPTNLKTEKIIYADPRIVGKTTNMYEDMLQGLVVTALDEDNKIVCGGSMISKITAAVPKSFWNGNKIVKILQVENYATSNFHEVTGLTNTMPESVSDDIAIIDVKDAKVHDAAIYSNGLWTPNLEILIKGLAFGMELEMKGPTELKKFTVTELKKNTVIVTLRTGSEGPKLPGEPLYHKKSILALYKDSITSGTEKKYEYTLVSNAFRILAQ